MNLLLIILYLIIILKFLYPFLIRYLEFPDLPWFTIHALILGIFITNYLKVFISNKKFVFSENKLKPYKYFFLIFISVVFVSALVNYNNMLFVIKSLFEYCIIYILLFLAIIELEMCEKDQENIIKFIYVLILLQIPVTAFQYLVIGSSDADSNSGTISDTNVGGTGIIAILMTFLLAFAVCQILVKGFSIKRVILILSTSIPIIAGGGRIAILLFPMTILLTVFSFFILKKNRKLSIFIKGFIIALILLMICALIIFEIIPQTKYAKFLDFNTVSSFDKIEKYDSGNSLKESRIRGYYILFNSVFKSDLNVVLGMGNEVITKSRAAGVENIRLDFLANRPDALVFLTSTGILGFGVIIFIILISIPLLKNYLYIEISEFMKIVAYSLIPTTFNVIVALFYTSAWSSHIGMIYWILLAILFQRLSVLRRGFVFFNALNYSEKSIPVINQES